MCAKKTRIEENKMSEEFWLKYGFKENGELICERTITKFKPASEFFYTDNGECKEVLNSNVVKITKNVVELFVSDKQEEK
jgi:hypothetical protein